MPVKEKAVPRVPRMKFSGPVEPEIASALAALKAYIKWSTSSPRNATKALKGAGILDSKGRVRKRYRP